MSTSPQSQGEIPVSGAEYWQAPHPLLAQAGLRGSPGFVESSGEGGG